ncbi:MAG TPA: DUF748 domain-containing protein [Magnetospirillum sp.]|nr:DUF748 domain-containing protein [Magnetospirillum sp.]
MWTRRRRLGAGLGVVTVAAVLAAGHWLPGWGLRWGLLRGLRDLGWDRVSVSNADLSLFNGAIDIHRVEVGTQLGKALGVDGMDLRFRWKPLFSRRVSVERLDVDGVDIDVRRDGDKMVINGLPLSVAGSGEGGSPWSYDVTDLTLTASRIHFVDGATVADIQVERLELQDLKSWEPDTPARIRFQGRVNGARLSLDGSATPFAGRPAFAATVGAEAFDLAGLADLLRRAGAGEARGRLDANLTVEGGIGAPMTLSGRATLKDGGWAGFGAKVAAAEADVSLTKLHWNGADTTLSGTLATRQLRIEAEGSEVGTGSGRLEVRSASFSAAQPFRVDGRLELEDARMAAFGALLEASRVAAEGGIDYGKAENRLLPVIGKVASVTVDQVWLRQSGQDLVHAERVEAGEATLAPTSATVARVDGRGLGLLSRPGKGGFPWRLEARQATVEKLEYSLGGVAAANLTLNGALGRVTRTKTGLLGLPEGGEGGTKPRLAVGRLRVAGDSKLEFDDRALPEPVRLRLDNVDVTASELDSARPDRDSPFSAKARLGAARLSAQGMARPFAPSPGGSAKAQVRALELPPLSSYVANTLGVHLETGHLDADVALNAQQGRLDGDMQLVLSELFVAQPDPNAPLAKSADMPIETVLDLLRDSDNRIHLSIPVRGDLSNPDFDISDAVGQAVGGALKSTMFTTLKVAFPLAGLISLVIDDSESRRLALEPLAFAPGSDALDEADHKRLGAVAGLMGQKAGLKLTLCGVAAQTADGPALAERKRMEDLGLIARLQKIVGAAPTPASLPVDHDRLTRLAEARAQAAKTFLVEQGGIDPDRLFTCRPRVEAEPKSIPRVDLVL